MEGSGRGLITDTTRAFVFGDVITKQYEVGVAWIPAQV